MDPARFIILVLSSLALGPKPRVEKLPEPDFMDRLWERNKLLFLTAFVVLAVAVSIALFFAAQFLPDSIAY